MGTWNPTATPTPRSARRPPSEQAAHLHLCKWALPVPQWHIAGSAHCQRRPGWPICGRVSLGLLPLVAAAAQGSAGASPADTIHQHVCVGLCTTFAPWPPAVEAHLLGEHVYNFCHVVERLVQL